MGDNPPLLLDRDARIKLSIGTKQPANADGLFSSPLGLEFDHHRGLLLVSDNNNRVQAFSCDDGSFVSRFGEEGKQPGQFQYPWDLRSITIMIASSSLTPTIIKYNHGL